MSYGIYFDEHNGWPVQIPDGEGSRTVGTAQTAEDAAALAREHGVDDEAQLYPRLDYCEWHVGF